MAGLVDGRFVATIAKWQQEDSGQGETERRGGGWRRQGVMIPLVEIFNEFSIQFRKASVGLVVFIHRRSSRLEISSRVGP